MNSKNQEHQGNHLKNAGKSALITGANKSIGLEVARQLAQKGFYVYIGSRNLQNGLQAVEKLKADGLENVVAVQLDVTEAESVKAARAEVGKKANRLDVLINNAGINGGGGLPQRTLDSDIESFKKVYETNLFGVVRVTQAFFDLLKNSPAPRIVNVTSSSASLTLQSDPTWAYYEHKAAVYSPSKTALNMLTVHLAYELRDTPFKVNAVCPGFTKTDFNNHHGTGRVEEAGKRIVKYALIDKNGPTGKFFSEDYNPETGEIPW
ncbi:NAD(P)-dependent dehydrogenase, short-chain alcohol dehydrogenase family [Parapedobacter luteus]|uniref:NAD(P)-dependent dehydrogenase, short-chain alcohol dehydrogenase family n=1 Tax=Parapedobacter luteus TaxID=623280 RepID=A0A1T5CZG6_9SPHI|nr:SDR family oxidoreductase [Parapedobacter luteus]SKB64908.1 NAD(P)-dependent dehydrogenase, short-chain alcohol dehydrogenase family [Parapedobacter luteus]